MFSFSFSFSLYLYICYVVIIPRGRSAVVSDNTVKKKKYSKENEMAMEVKKTSTHTK